MAYTIGVVDSTVSMLIAALNGRAEADVSLGYRRDVGSGCQGRHRQSGDADSADIHQPRAGEPDASADPDGGWVLLLVLEGIKGSPLQPEFEGVLRFVGLALLVLLMVYATVSDISRMIVPRL